MESLKINTEQKVALPSILDDKKNIDFFIDQNKGKKIVVVQGLGFVGAVMSLVVANSLTEEYAVIGVDLPSENTYWKIHAINNGVFPVSSSDKKIEIFFKKSQEKKNLYATYDSYAYSLADVVIVDINLDVKKNSDKDKNLLGYDVNLNGFKKAIEDIAKNCKPEVLVLVETTVPPGTCQKIVAPIFDAVFNDRNLPKLFKIGHSYERVMPGPGYVDSIQNFYRVYSGIDEASSNATEVFLKTIIRTDEYPLTRLNSTNATEMAKVLENSFRAMNIAFISEWAEFAEEAQVNLFEVLDAIRMRPTHKNIMSPGLGVGGYCLPKDPLLASWSKQNLFSSKNALKQSEAAVIKNDQMPRHTFEVIENLCDGNLKDKKVALIGVSYLNNVGDTRYTPVELLYDLLIESQSVVSLTDPYIAFWEERKLNVHATLEHLMNESPEVLVFCTKHSEFSNSSILHQLIESKKDLFIVDACGILENSLKEKIINQKHRLKIIGRGDI